MLMSMLAFAMLGSGAADWTRKYVGAKESCLNVLGEAGSWGTQAEAEQACVKFPNCVGVYSWRKGDWRSCAKITSDPAKITSQDVVYRRPYPQFCHWGDKVKGSIPSANVHQYKDLTVTDCKKKCEANDLCKSIDFKLVSGGRGDCNLGNCRMGEGCINDGDAEWIHYSCPKHVTSCHNNKLTTKVEIQGSDLELKSPGFKGDLVDMTSSQLKAFFPECEWDQDQVKSNHWEMKNCQCGGTQCNQCGYAELCSEMCGQSKACKYITYHGMVNATGHSTFRCHPKSAGGSGSRRAVTGEHAGKDHFFASGTPAPMCFVWTEAGVLEVKRWQKEGTTKLDYGSPAVNKAPPARLIKDLASQPSPIKGLASRLEFFLRGSHSVNPLLKKTGCAIQGQITNRATFVQPLWVAFIAMSCVVMQ